MTETLPNLVWVDLETTGLDEKTEKPLEIAVVVTDQNLETRYEGSWVLRQHLELDRLSDFALDVHMKSGLLAEVARSSMIVRQVDWKLSQVMLQSVLFPLFPLGDDRPPLCGSSINFERSWLAKFFPEFYKHLHYRSIDVSSVKELMKRWWPEEAISRRDTSAHRALPDIYDSIDELKHYRSLLFR